MILSGKLTVDLDCSEVLTMDAESGRIDLKDNAVLKFVPGTSAGECDLKWSKTSTLAAGASETWTLSALVDALGRTVAFARVRAVLIVNTSDVDGDDLVVGAAASHEWAAIVGGAGDTFKVKSLGLECKAAMNTTGFPVAVGASDQLKITNGGANPVTYRIALLGASS